MSQPDPSRVAPAHHPKPNGSPRMPGAGEVGGEGRSPGSGAGGDGGDDSERTPPNDKD